MKELLTYIVQSLVEKPDEVSVGQESISRNHGLRYERATFVSVALLDYCRSA